MVTQATLQVLKGPAKFQDPDRSAKIASIRILRIVFGFDLKLALRILLGEPVTLKITDAYVVQDILTALGAVVTVRPMIDEPVAGE